MTASVVVSVAVEHEGRYLMVQEGKEYCYGQWGLPGGRVEEGEALADAAVREVMEETGCGVRITGMTRVLRYRSQYGFHCVRFNFVGQYTGGLLSADGVEILTCDWFSLQHLHELSDASLRSPQVARTIFRDLAAGLIYPVESIYDGFAPTPLAGV